MAPSSKRSRKNDDDDDDDDSDDEFLAELKPTFVRSSRSSAEAKKARKDAEHKRFMNGLLKSGEQTLEKQTRLDEAHQRSSVIKSPVLMEDEHKMRSSPEHGKENADNMKVAKALFGQKSTSEDASVVDIKATMCLGSRNTLQLQRIIINPRNVSENPSMNCAWSSIDVARKEFHCILHWEKQKLRQKKKSNPSAPPSSSTNFLLDQLLERTSSNNDLALFLQQQWLCDQQETQICKLPIHLLHWLFAMACAPIATIVRSNKNVDSGSICLATSLINAKLGAYKTLAGLWTCHMGRPLEGTHVLTLKALTDQLRDWFGSSFRVIKNDNESSSLDENEKNFDHSSFLLASTTPSTIFRFFHLWELALLIGCVRLISKGSSKDNLEQDLQQISFAIMATLWAALDPIFGSNTSTYDDGTKSIQRMVGSLIDAVRCNVPDDVYNTWIRSVSRDIHVTWSTQLGGGRKGTDAKDDEHAWLAIARTVQCLGNNANGFPCRDLQLELIRVALFHAFNETGAELSDSSIADEQKDWLSESIDTILKDWNVPANLHLEQCWVSIACAHAAISKLSSNFPFTYPTICLAVVECAVVCISMGMHDLQHQADVDFSLQRAGEATPGKNAQDVRDETRTALCCALEQLEGTADRVSSICRSRIMQNKCFPRSSSVIECLKSYTRLLRGLLVPPTKSLEGQQTKINSFFNSSS